MDVEQIERQRFASLSEVAKFAGYVVEEGDCLMLDYTPRQLFRLRKQELAPGSSFYTLRAIDPPEPHSDRTPPDTATLQLVEVASLLAQAHLKLSEALLEIKQSLRKSE